MDVVVLGQCVHHAHKIGPVADDEPQAHYVDHAAASWAVRILDVAAENSADEKPPRLRAVLTQCRGALCAVVRKGQKIVVYAGAPVPARVDEWIDRLKHGELSWQEISQG